MTFRANYHGIGELLNSPQMVAEMRRRAEKVKARAEATAPFDVQDRDGNHYRDAFSVEAEPYGGVHKDRAYGRVVNDNEAAIFVEFGNKNTDAHRTLGRALDEAGE